MKFDIQSWAAILAIILAITGSTVGVMVWVDSKIDALRDELRTEITEINDEIRTEINRNETETQALIAGLIEQLDEQGIEFRNKIDANTSELRSEVFLHDERLLSRVDALFRERQDDDRRISYLEAWAETERPRAGGG